MILVNSVPKSGTNLLKQAMTPFGPYQGHFGMYDGSSGKKWGHAALVSILEGLADQEGYVTCHLHWRPEFEEVIRSSGMKVIYLYRDPRDMVVSHAHYVKKTASHSLHGVYKELGLQACIRLSMSGMPNERRFEFPDIANRYLPYLGWRQPGYYRLQFEDVIGFSLMDWESLASFCGDVSAATEMMMAIRPEESPTYRQGKAGGWTEEMDAENQAYFKEHFNWFLDLVEGSYEQA